MDEDGTADVRLSSLDFQGPVVLSLGMGLSRCLPQARCWVPQTQALEMILPVTVSLPSPG
jgi:hypothetical protein